MKAFTKTILIVLAALVVFAGLTQSIGLSSRLEQVSQTANPYAKIGVITIAGPALILLKWNNKTE